MKTISALIPFINLPTVSEQVLSPHNNLCSPISYKSPKTVIGIAGGVVSIGQPVGTTSNVVFGNVTASGNAVINGKVNKIKDMINNIEHSFEWCGPPFLEG